LAPGRTARCRQDLRRSSASIPLDAANENRAVFRVAIGLVKAEPISVERQRPLDIFDKKYGAWVPALHGFLSQFFRETKTKTHIGISRNDTAQDAIDCYSSRIDAHRCAINKCPSDANDAMQFDSAKLADGSLQRTCVTNNSFAVSLKEILVVRKTLLQAPQFDDTNHAETPGLQGGQRIA
jgi:hypothetical protein